MLPKIQALAVEGVTVECRKSTEKTLIYGYLDYDYHAEDYGGFTEKRQNKLKYPGQFEMICYKAGDNSTLLDSSGKLKWDDLHEDNLWMTLRPWMADNPIFVSMETSFNFNVFERWILSDRCNPNHHCGDVWNFNALL